MEINRKGFFDYYLVMSHMTTLFLATLTPQLLLVLPCHRFENFLIHISNPKKTKKKQKKLIKFTLNLMVLQVPTHLVQVM